MSFGSVDRRLKRHRQKNGVSARAAVTTILPSHSAKEASRRMATEIVSKRLLLRRKQFLDKSANYLEIPYMTEQKLRNDCISG
jgi:hypothetical protein